MKKRESMGGGARHAAASKRVREKPGLETISKLSMRGTRGEDKLELQQRHVRTFTRMHACMQACAVGRSLCGGFFQCADSNAPPLALLELLAVQLSIEERGDQMIGKPQKFWKAERFLERYWQAQPRQQSQDRECV